LALVIWPNSFAPVHLPCLPTPTTQIKRLQIFTTSRVRMNNTCIYINNVDWIALEFDVMPIFKHIFILERQYNYKVLNET
jgi:hypothetical protein